MKIFWQIAAWYGLGSMTTTLGKVLYAWLRLWWRRRQLKRLANLFGGDAKAQAAVNKLAKWAGR